jgi:hypothetical protein
MARELIILIRLRQVPDMQIPLWKWDLYLFFAKPPDNLENEPVNHGAAFLRPHDPAQQFQVD